MIKHRGSGSPRRVVACGLDDQGYVVSEVTDAGYLRLAANGRARRVALWDQFHEGQRVRILTATGIRPGVVAVRSTHLWRRRPANEPIVTIEDLWVDVGAASRADVAALGVTVLDPVEREWPTVRFGNVVAGPGAAARAGCAAIAGAAFGTPAHGETIWVIAAQHAFADAGLTAALARIGRVDTLVLVDPAVTRAATATKSPADSATLKADGMAVKAEGTGNPVVRSTVPSPAALPASVHIGATIALSVRSYFPGTLVESLRADDIAALMDSVAAASGVPAGHHPSVALKPTAPPGPPPPYPATDDSLSPVARVLGKLSDVYGASGHEADVRVAVRSALPDRWVRQHPTVDTAGNLIVAAGPDRDTVVFIAHLDELGFNVTRITPDGVVALKPLGGFYNSLWEGQPALLHTAKGTLTGVFIPRSTATVKQPDTLYAWFGVDSAALAAAGAGASSWATGIKLATRLGATRFSARSIDDRAGSTALLMALDDVDPSRLDHKVIFCWSVREEVGLNGAAALAAELGPTVRRVHAVDTFVSSDSPLESPRFALAPIGDGAVVRALDNSSVTPAAETDRVRQIADAAHIPLQVGVTNGGNDGSEFVRYGAVDVPLAWPLRYSHSPAELIDLRDVRALSQLVAALANAPSR